MDHLLDSAALGVCDHRIERGQVAVNVGDDREAQAD
jgi:hypothetical protein